MVQLLYGSGLCLLECLRVRVKDIDFEYRTITVRDGKDEKDHIVSFPETVILDLHRQIERVRLLHKDDLAAGYGNALLTPAAARNAAITSTQPAYSAPSNRSPGKTAGFLLFWA